MALVLKAITLLILCYGGDKVDTIFTETNLHIQTLEEIKN